MSDSGSEGRRERGAGAGERGSEKGRIIQDRDRLGLALVGMCRVVLERSLRQVLFPGRDDATFGNRVWELARELQPVGAYWRVHRRMREDGMIERYLSLTDIGYRQAELALGPGWFQRRPTDELRPSHVLHDLELADLALDLLPRGVQAYQPRVRGRPSGPPVQIPVVFLPKRWRWFHASVFRRLTVLAAPDGTSRPKVLLAYEPDAIFETNAFNVTRYFIEYDRGTEPIAGAKETRTIADKLRRIREYFWVTRGMELARPHWTERRSYYLHAFRGEDLRWPKCLFVTRSVKRAENIRRLAAQVLAREFPDSQLAQFLEVLTVEAARKKLCRVAHDAEQCSGLPPEMPWVSELRQLQAAEAAAKARAAAQAQAAEAARSARAEEQASRPQPARDEAARGGRMTWEQVQAQRRKQEEAERRQKQGMMGKLKDFMVGPPE